MEQTFCSKPVTRCPRACKIPADSNKMIMFFWLISLIKVKPIAHIFSDTSIKNAKSEIDKKPPIDLKPAPKKL
jgi:hypothetical protein